MADQIARKNNATPVQQQKIQVAGQQLKGNPSIHPLYRDISPLGNIDINISIYRFDFYLLGTATDLIQAMKLYLSNSSSKDSQAKVLSTIQHAQSANTKLVQVRNVEVALHLILGCLLFEDIALFTFFVMLKYIIRLLLSNQMIK